MGFAEVGLGDAPVPGDGGVTAAGPGRDCPAADAVTASLRGCCWSTRHGVSSSPSPCAVTSPAPLCPRSVMWFAPHPPVDALSGSPPLPGGTVRCCSCASATAGAPRVLGEVGGYRGCWRCLLGTRLCRGAAGSWTSLCPHPLPAPAGTWGRGAQVPLFSPTPGETSVSGGLAWGVGVPCPPHPSPAFCTGWGVAGYLWCEDRKLPLAEAPSRARGSPCLACWGAGSLLGDRHHGEGPEPGSCGQAELCPSPQPRVLRWAQIPHRGAPAGAGGRPVL